MKGLSQELKRRNVYRLTATYAVVAFLTLQAAKLISPPTTLEWLYGTLVVVAFVGLPIALVIAWAFELTPERVGRTPEGEAAGSKRAAPRSPSRTAARRRASTWTPAPT